MNEFESQLVDKVLEGVHEIELKVADNVATLKGDIKALDKDIKSLKESVDKNIETDNKRLDKYSEELDAHSEKIAKLEEWRDEFKRQVTNRIAFSNSVATIAAVIIAYLLSKFL